MQYQLSMKHTIQGNFISGLELGRCLDRKLVYVRVEQSMSKVMIIELCMKDIQMKMCT